MTKRLYYHKTSGGAEYLFDTFIPWSHNGKSGKEGCVTDETRIVVRLDGKYPELTGPILQDRADLLDALKAAITELDWLRDNASIKTNHGDYVEIETDIIAARALIARLK